jgi:hypothetical protein
MSKIARHAEEHQRVRLDCLTIIFSHLFLLLTIFVIGFQSDPVKPNPSSDFRVVS